MLRCFLSYYRRYRMLTGLLALGAILGALLELLFPWGVRHILQTELPSGEWNRILRWCFWLGMAYCLNFLLLFAVSWGSGILSAGMENDMRKDLFAHLQKLPFAFFDHAHTGQLLATLTGDVAEAGELASRIPNDLLVCCFSLTGTAFLLVTLDPYLGSAVVLLMGAKAIHTAWINLKLRDSFQAVRQEYGRLSALGEENLNGIRMVKAFTAETHNRRSFARAAGKYFQARRKSFQIRAYFNASINLFTNSINLLILLLGAWRIRQGAMDLGDLVAFFLYVGVFLKPVMKLTLFVETYQKSMAGFRRFYGLLEEPEESGGDLPGLPPLRGRIEFRDVSFQYPGGRPILRHISFILEPGTKAAFVGATGAGKTTLVSLLLRFYEPTEGCILVDGLDIRQYSRESLRKQIGLVSQDVFLFSDSIRHNIAYGDFSKPAEAIGEAAEAARALDFIQDLPAAFATEIGERGVRLSGGQRQRLALARAFLKDAPIVVLDEATSALDNITERQIQGELEKLARGRTTLMVAHRLSTVSQADTILVLDQGRIVEKGPPAELLQRQGLYYALWKKEAGIPTAGKREGK
ncbi:ABC transporter ATP-binding protein [Acidaminococcus massiliensis]|jgi:ATP-binding cassette subfamily B protein|uniref:ABC transporter ATP-binding protein n=1 Tax=Acidaminococcus massiliensis TaxID=1852375 RepID=UPI0022E30283|nr:ABC transporter ATP-binding protein [Acidaminococcus massiliensis]